MKEKRIIVNIFLSDMSNNDDEFSSVVFVVPTNISECEIVDKIETTVDKFALYDEDECDDEILIDCISTFGNCPISVMSYLEMKYGWQADKDTNIYNFEMH